MNTLLLLLVVVDGAFFLLFRQACRHREEAMKGWEEANDTNQNLVTALRLANDLLDAQDEARGEEWKHSDN